MIVNGNCPKNLVYFSRNNPEKISFQWDDDDDNNGQKIDVYPTYVSDAINKKTLLTGKAWATRNKNTPVEEKKANTPLTGVRIAGLERRSKGGRAYNVLIEEKYYVDLREDVLLDIILNSTIKEGVIDCPLIWCKVNSEMKLVRQNSDLHLAVLENEARIAQKPISKPVVGTEYTTNDKSRYIFLGNVESVKYETNYNYQTRQSVYTQKAFKGQCWFYVPYYHNLQSINITDLKGVSILDKEYYVEFVGKKKITGVTGRTSDLTINVLQKNIQDNGHSTLHSIV